MDSINHVDGPNLAERGTIPENATRVIGADSQQSSWSMGIAMDQPTYHEEADAPQHLTE